MACVVLLSLWTTQLISVYLEGDAGFFLIEIPLKLYIYLDFLILACLNHKKTFKKHKFNIFLE
jgi:hypothetical protein